jgi:hypothetical protein
MWGPRVSDWRRLRASRPLSGPRWATGRCWAEREAGGLRGEGEVKRPAGETEGARADFACDGPKPTRTRTGIGVKG